jgi:hypothetical protein
LKIILCLLSANNYLFAMQKTLSKNKASRSVVGDTVDSSSVLSSLPLGAKDCTALGGVPVQIQRTHHRIDVSTSSGAVGVTHDSATKSKKRVRFLQSQVLVKETRSESCNADGIVCWNGQSWQTSTREFTPEAVVERGRVARSKGSKS